MWKAKSIVYAVILTLSISLACSSQSSDPKVYADSADTVSVKMGERFKIALESNPSTGYGWRFVSDVDSSLLKLMEHQYIAKPNPEKVVGRGGHDEWLFEAIAAGSTSVALEYLRPWDSTSVEREVEFQIFIGE
ncbi:MAG: protease inhibitor I42 family protein [Candidatus Zixiibacteriota bacterium]